MVLKNIYIFQDFETKHFGGHAKMIFILFFMMKKLEKYIFWQKLRRNLNINIINRKEKGECMLECTQFEKEKKQNIISKVLTHQISFLLNYFKNHI